MTQASEASADTGSRRTWSNALIVVVLAYHVGMPLTYYLGDRVYDERFSWRMFSTVRLQQCEVVITETVTRGGVPTEVPTPVAKDVQAAWISLLQRLRPAVVEKYLARRCEKAEATQAKLVGRCRDTDGKQLPEQRFVMTCADRAFSVEAAP